jgi:hypothetical protein
LLLAAALRPDDFFAAGFALLFEGLAFAVLLALEAPLFDGLFFAVVFALDFAVLLAAISRLPFGPGA